jgi:hypothetical protein
MIVARVVVFVGLIAAVGCASNHSGDPDPERAEGGSNTAGGPARSQSESNTPGSGRAGASPSDARADASVAKDAGSNAADGGLANSCVVTTVGPRIFPDDGPCDDSDPVRGEFTLTPSGHYIVTCKPQPLEAAGCKGVPNDVWNSCALRRCEASVSYPKGCQVMMPTGNPHQGNYADSCECSDPIVKGELKWWCAG